MSRYFIGFLLPRQAQEILVSFKDAIIGSLPPRYPYAVSWSKPADLHCTLLYLGDIDDLDALDARLQDLTGRLPAYEVQLGGTTHWLGHNSLAVGITGAHLLGQAVIDEFAALSSDRWAGRRPFHGHVTLGRVRPVPEAGVDCLTDHRLAPCSWRVEQIQLLRSRNNIDPQRYESVAEYQLNSDNSEL